ncbi:hypothetical protein BDM02DRAFT_3192056 [Thelephora ganbajun]|uniref:Uncharacterized protein n=1 Tax=Thelephora ganbajun TaxID=370292 RepID=A0ACB6Z0F8_THEGA|nr:hypothetical protein BDM02DRAFT_3192056 [Thelephora ganbajun]
MVNELEGEARQEGPADQLKNLSPGDDDNPSGLSDSDLESDVYYDNDDLVYRCGLPGCGWEVAFGLCQNCRCGAEHGSLDELELDGAEIDVPTQVSLAPRGMTPEPELVHASFIPLEYLNREEEFAQLVSRGVSCSMCQRFCMEFSTDEGIVLWADEPTFDLFSPGWMEEGSCWKIFIGRAVDLAGGDQDGWEFVTEFLEQILWDGESGEEDEGGFQRWVTVLEMDRYESEFVNKVGKGEEDLQEEGQEEHVEDSYPESDEPEEEGSTGEECSGDEEVYDYARNLPQEILDITDGVDREDS